MQIKRTKGIQIEQFNYRTELNCSGEWWMTGLLEILVREVDNILVVGMVLEQCMKYIV